ncbi:protein rhomboid isoform X2 [Leptinotarsa decemlineata]
MVDQEGRNSKHISPLNTPNASVDEEKCLVSYQLRPKVKKKLCRLENIPFAVLCISVTQILFHIFASSHVQKCLRFEPKKRIEIWRFVTYMLVHDDWYHLMLNVVIQCIFAILLEKRQGHLRVVILYILGGITGVLGASCIHPDLVIGASAGVYALLISNIADIVLNFTSVKYKVYRGTSIAVLVIFDVIYNIVHVCAKKEPVISWEAHFVGGATGLLMGFVIYRCHDKTERMAKFSIINKSLFWIGLIFFAILFISFVILCVQIKKCTPVNVIHVRYVYFC